MTQQVASANHIDYLVVVIVGALLIIGLMMVYSTTFVLGYASYGDPAYFLIRQGLWAALGLTCMILMARIRYHHWHRTSILIMATSLLLLGVVLVFGKDKFGSTRWLLDGSIQPSEFCKLATIIYIADWLSSKGDRIRQVSYGLIPFAILIGLVAGLILLQPDFSTAFLIILTALVMFFLTGAEFWQLLSCTFLGGLTLLTMIVQSPYRMTRITAFLNNPLDPAGPLETNYQIREILIALGSGGITGLGLGASRQKFGYIPASHTDGIFAILGEELGLIGCLIVIGLFVALAYRGFKIALEAPDSFGTLLASGVTCCLTFQALLNLAIITATVPIAGIPLPFISFGGSSLVVSMISIGLLLSVSRGSVPEELKERARDDLRRRDRRARIPGPDHRRAVVK
jgi:cell division protein FtsW